jgi:hypothetical protein
MYSIRQMAEAVKPDSCRGAGSVAQGAEAGGTNMGHMAYCYVSHTCCTFGDFADKQVTTQDSPGAL